MNQALLWYLSGELEVIEVTPQIAVTEYLVKPDHFFKRSRIGFMFKGLDTARSILVFVELTADEQKREKEAA